MIEPRISVVTLGVHDLARARAFYCDGLGWKPSPASTESIVFIQAGALALALFPWDFLAEDANLQPGSDGFRGVTLAYNTRTREEVDELMRLAAASGGRGMRPAAETPWGGYAGYFADPDAHLWEAVWNPHFELGPGGELILPK